MTMRSRGGAVTLPECEPIRIKCPKCGAEAVAHTAIDSASDASVDAVASLVREVALSMHQCGKETSVRAHQ